MLSTTVDVSFNILENIVKELAASPENSAGWN
jgi:hypothetical protein